MALFAVATLALAACGGDDSESSAADTGSPQPAETSPPAEGEAPGDGDASEEGGPGLAGAACPALDEVAEVVDPAISYADEYRIGEHQDLVCEYLVGATDEAPAVSVAIELDSPESAGPPAGAEPLEGPGEWAVVMEDGSVLVASGADLIRVRMAPSPQDAVAVAGILIDS